VARRDCASVARGGTHGALGRMPAQASGKPDRTEVAAQARLQMRACALWVVSVFVPDAWPVLVRSCTGGSGRDARCVQVPGL